MTAPDPRLDEIQARAEGLTDLCPEYLRQGIRHLQRNCDIYCNEAEENDEHDCRQPDRYDGDRMAAVLADIPYLLAELRKRDEMIFGLNSALELASAARKVMIKQVREARAAVAAANGVKADGTDSGEIRTIRDCTNKEVSHEYWGD